MDCNKEEAIRAKEIAEKKMQSSDFFAARKIALKAQKLDPDLENICQMLTVCDVHCSAQNKIYGSEMDWYGILQVERVADEATIKKQYRKLALVLHPDKNKFAGAEAAFKLIVDANKVLSDQDKRSLYDMKFRGPVRPVAPKPPPHQVNRNSFVKKQYGGRNNFPNVANSQFKGLNPHQQTQGFHNGQETFWTCCPFCNMKYQYYKDIVNRTLRCPNCVKAFTAYDLGAQGVPQGPKWNQPSVFSHQTWVPNPKAFQMGSQSAGGKPSSVMGFQRSVSNRSAASESLSKAGSSAGIVGGSKTKGKDDGHVDEGGGKEGVGIPKCDAEKPGESGTSKKRGRKSGRKSVVESSESSESATSDSAEDSSFQENVCNFTGGNSGLNKDQHPTRRSSRQKQHVSYNESSSDEDDDLIIPPKKARGVKVAPGDGGTSKAEADCTTARDRGEKEVKQKATVPLEESLPNRKREVEECEVNGTEAASTDYKDETKVHDTSESNPNIIPEVYQYPDPDFSDFDKDKREDCFAVGQLWAIYDEIDGMPRFYAQVGKVFSPGFKLEITWLEPYPDEKAEIAWASAGLPVACGKFRLGNEEKIADHLMFSHQVEWIEGSSSDTFVIYPRKGEIWALFKDWDIKWSSNPENHQRHKFEYVEVLSDYMQDYGIGVAYLGKVKGFVSLFQKTMRNGGFSFRIPPNDLYRFSHRIPSFRMTGTEREGVPEGSFELDPVSLPTDLDDFGDLIDVKTNSESMDAVVNGSSSKSPARNVKPMMGSERIETSIKHEKIDLGRETSKLRRSPRESNSTQKKLAQVNASQRTPKEDSDKNVDGSKDECHGNLDRSRGSTSCQADENINSPKKHEKNDVERESSKLRRSMRNLSGKKHSEVNASQHMAQDDTDKHFNGSKDGSHGSLPQSRGSPSGYADERKMHSDEERSFNGSRRNSVVTSPISLDHRRVPYYYNFNEHRSEEKFETGQIWALYSDRDSLPKIYAQVKKIESTPDFKLHVALLEACSSPKVTIHPVCCGIFKLKIV